MNIAITGLSGLRDGVIAAGIRSLIEGMELGVNVNVEGATVAPQPAAETTAPPVAKRVKRGRPAGVKKFAAKTREKAAKTPVERAVASPRHSGGGVDPRGSVRDAVRAALTTSGRDLTTMMQEVQRVFPEKNRDYIGTVLCQLSKGGECELGTDGNWRKSK